MADAERCKHPRLRPVRLDCAVYGFSREYRALFDADSCLVCGADVFRPGTDTRVTARAAAVRARAALPRGAVDARARRQEVRMAINTLGMPLVQLADHVGVSVRELRAAADGDCGDALFQRLMTVLIERAEWIDPDRLVQIQCKAG